MLQALDERAVPDATVISPNPVSTPYVTVDSGSGSESGSGSGSGSQYISITTAPIITPPVLVPPIPPADPNYVPPYVPFKFDPSRPHQYVNEQELRDRYTALYANYYMTKTQLDFANYRLNRLRSETVELSVQIIDAFANNDPLKARILLGKQLEFTDAINELVTYKAQLETLMFDIISEMRQIHLYFDGVNLPALPVEMWSDLPTNA